LFFASYAPHPGLPSFPTRRSSDLEPAVRPETSRCTLEASWEAELGALPPDWSDVYAEIELASTDYLERAALLLSPVNPSRYGERDRKSTRLNSSHLGISYAVFCLK